MRRSSRTFARWLVPAWASCLAACPQNLSVDLVPGSTVQDLRFRLSNHAGTAESGELWRFRVVEFGGAAPGDATTLWEIVAEDRGANLAELTYGVAPPGFRTERVAGAFTPGGRYMAIGGSAGVEFRVAPDGAVSPFHPTDAGDSFEVAGLSPEAVELFMRQLHSALRPPAPGAVADLVYFPLHVRSADSSWIVADPAALVDQFDDVLPAGLRGRLLDVEIRDLVTTSRGVALLDGAVWVGAACGTGGRAVCPPRIFELHHFAGPGN